MPAPFTLEIRLHGRGGQGGVTCAKILAAIYTRLGKSVQTFGDYAGERSGAPVRAYTRVSEQPITNRNKVYEPHHVLVLDSTLIGDDAVAGLAVGGTLLVDSPNAPRAFADRFGRFRVATVDATAIARKHKIGTRSVVIVNTTIAGAFAKALDLPWRLLAETYDALGFRSNLEAAREAYESVRIAPAIHTNGTSAGPSVPAPVKDVEAITAHVESPPPLLRTGSWRSQRPRYTERAAPCSAWCPAGNDVIGFVQAIAREGLERAAAILGETTPLAGVCGRVCPAPCQEGCNRREYDGAVNIRGLERWIADRSQVARSPVTAIDDARSIAIVGGGPAGLGAAYTIARTGHRATIFEGEAKLGGVLRTGIPAYRLPRDVLDREIDAILALGVEARCGTFLSKERLAKLHHEFDAVILATGLQRLRGLDVPGSDLAGIEQGIRYLHRANHGGSKVDGHVFVLGGGNTAMDCARSALRSGASQVTVAYRRGRAEMPAIPEEIHEAIDEGVTLLELRAPAAFAGNGRVEAIELAEVDLGEPDETGRRRPVVSDRTEGYACDAVLLAIGQFADLSLLPEGWEPRDGRIHVDGKALPVYLAGDLGTGEGTVAHAIGDGRRAAGEALRELDLDVKVFARPSREEAIPATDIRFDHFLPAPPARDRLESLGARRSFSEVNTGLPDTYEAHRCFSCGHCTDCDTCLVYCPDGVIRRTGSGYEIDYSYCKGCGICTTECPRGSMELLPECPPS